MSQESIDIRTVIDETSVHIRLLNREDRSALVKVASHPDIYSNVYTIRHPFGGADADQWISRSTIGQQNSSEVLLALVDKETGRYFASVNYHRTDLVFHSGRSGEMELGFWIEPRYQRRGFVRSAIALSLSEAVPKLKPRYLMATASEQNIPSQRLLCSIGFKCQKKMNVKQSDGLLRPTLLYHMSTEDALLWAEAHLELLGLPIQ